MVVSTFWVKQGLNRGLFAKLALSLLGGMLLPQVVIASNPTTPEIQLSPVGTLAATDQTLISQERQRWTKLIVQTLSRLFPEMRIIRGGQKDDALLTLLEHSFEATNHQTSGSTRQIELRLVNSPEANAFATPAERGGNSPATIRLTYDLLNQIHTESELAFVLAHELAHIRRNHFSMRFPTSMLTAAQLSRIRSVHEGWELDADKLAIADMIKAGLNPADAGQILNRLEEDQVLPTEVSRDPCTRSHPLLTTRLESLRREINQSERTPGKISQLSKISGNS